jgi:glyoxylase-like metal-dependent hydrolase (beta-lactamase superfamily II)
MSHDHRLSRRAVLAGAAATAAAGWPHERAFAKAPMRNTQAPAFYRSKLGAFEITVVSDGPLTLGPPSGDVFKGVSREEMIDILNNNRLPTDKVDVEQNVVVVNTGRHLVLFDTGTGPALKAFGPDTGRLLTNLRAAGIYPKTIDAIALTHAHADHCFGLMSEAGRRNFPNAQIYMSQAELEFWTDESKAVNDMMKMMVGGARKNLLPNRDRMVFVKDGQEIVPGIQAMATAGHTVGHTSYMITSQGRSLLNIGDVCHHHIISTEKPRIPFAYDTDGQQGVASRLRAFDMLATTRTPLIAYHFPWPGIGFIGKHGEGYRYYPAPMRTVL